MKVFVFLSLVTILPGCYGALSGSECFTEGTMINTPSGMVPIEAIKQGDTVTSYLAGDMTLSDAVVVETEVHAGRTDVYEITFADQSQLRATADHKFPTGAKLKKLRVIELQVGDVVSLMTDAETLSPTAITNITKIDNDLPVYNLVVRNSEGSNYYFAEGVLTLDY